MSSPTININKDKKIAAGFIEELQKVVGIERIIENEPLSKHTTMRIGGPARIFVKIKDTNELIHTINLTRIHKIPFFILGGGTNTIPHDSGFAGVVIKNISSEIKMRAYGGIIKGNSGVKKRAVISVNSGVPVNQLVRFTLEENLSGIEAFLGQPGTVGGAIYINAHNMKMGEYFGDKISAAIILNDMGEQKKVDKRYFKFGYDESRLQYTAEIVLSVEIPLVYGEHDQIWNKANTALNHRKDTQPQGSGSSGCTFRNISPSQALKIGTPNITTSAGFLLDVCGLKGLTIGGAKYAEDHANFIINFNHATSADIDELIRVGKQKVFERFGIQLKEEIVRPKPTM